VTDLPPTLILVSLNKDTVKLANFVLAKLASFHRQQRFHTQEGGITMFTSYLNVSSKLPVKLFQRFRQVLPGFPIIPSVMIFLSLNTVFAQDRLPRAFSHGSGFGWSLFSLLGSLIFIALLVVAVLYLLQLFRSRGGLVNAVSRATSAANNSVANTSASYTSVPNDPALNILRERLAKGEIDTEDYEARKRILLDEAK
jgi:uncharacterized membrane protein